MPIGSDPALPALIVIASIITLLMFTGAGAVGTFFVWRHARSVRRRDPDGAAKPGETYAILFYVLSALFWVVGLVGGILFMREARTARAAAICATLSIAQVVAIAWATCLTIAVFAEEIAGVLPP